MIEQLRRKANQHWELAGLARLERDFADEARHMRLARELERRIREMKVFGEAEVADECDRLKERVAELERERNQLLDKLHCMCGSPIDHSAWEGHTPVSVYDYSLDQERSRAEAAEAKLAEAMKVLDALDRVNRGVDWCDQYEQARRWFAARKFLKENGNGE